MDECDPRSDHPRTVILSSTSPINKSLFERSIRCGNIICTPRRAEVRTKSITVL